MTFKFSRISKTNLEPSVEYLQRYFLNHLTCFFLEQTTDRQIELLFWVLRYRAHCTRPEFLPEPPQNKICYRLHLKYTYLSCFPTICSSAVWKPLFLRNRSYLQHFDIFERSWVIVSFCRQLLLLADYSFVHFLKV